MDSDRRDDLESKIKSPKGAKWGPILAAASIVYVAGFTTNFFIETINRNSYSERIFDKNFPIEERNLAHEEMIKNRIGLEMFIPFYSLFNGRYSH